jgi:hypothetical protein
MVTAKSYSTSQRVSNTRRKSERIVATAGRIILAYTVSVYFIFRGKVKLTAHSY